MRLYHFTAERFIGPIMAEGLTRGRVLRRVEPDGYSISMLRNKQWLTASDSWDQECLKGTGRLPYSRTEARLTIDIPPSHIDRVVKWLAVCKQMSREWRELNRYGDPHNWWLYLGVMPPGFITRVDHNPELVKLSLLGVGRGETEAK